MFGMRPLLLLVTLPAYAGTFYAMDNTTNNLYTFSQSDPSVKTLLGTVSGVSQISGLAYDSTRARLVGANGTGIFAIDPNTLTASLIGNHGIPFGSPGAHGLEYVPSEDAFYSIANLFQIHRLNATTGASTYIANLPSNGSVTGGQEISDGLAYNLLTDTLIASTNRNEYRAINRVTGALTTLFAMPTAMNNHGLAYDSEQNLLYDMRQRSSFYAVNSTTGAATQVFFTDLSLNLHSLAFVPDAVPEPATWALLGAGLLICASRRRR